MHEVDRGVYYDRYVYYDMGMLAWHAAVRRYPRLAIGRLGGSRARRILDGLPTEMVASPCCREGVTVANPRLLKKYNYRVVWADTAKGPTSLRVENYAHGSDAALDSWVVLERKEGGAGGAE